MIDEDYIEVLELREKRVWDKDDDNDVDVLQPSFNSRWVLISSNKPFN